MNRNIIVDTLLACQPFGREMPLRFYSSGCFFTCLLADLGFDCFRVLVSSGNILLGVGNTPVSKISSLLIEGFLRAHPYVIITLCLRVNIDMTA